MSLSGTHPKKNPSRIRVLVRLRFLLYAAFYTSLIWRSSLYR